MPHVRDHHDAVSGGNAEDGDEADHRSDRYFAARDDNADDTADQGERQVDHDQQCITHGSKDDVQEEADAQYDDEAENSENARGLLGAFELPAVFHVVTRGQLDPFCNGPPNVVDHAGQFAVSYVAHDDDLALDVFAA